MISCLKKMCRTAKWGLTKRCSAVLWEPLTIMVLKISVSILKLYNVMLKSILLHWVVLLACLSTLQRTVLEMLKLKILLLRLHQKMNPFVLKAVPQWGDFLAKR